MTEQGLLAQLHAVKGENVNASHSCAVSRWLKTLSEKERKEYASIVDSRDYPASSLGRVLRKNGIKISDQQIRYHRNRIDLKGCSCDVSR